ncbi:hypothetical protein NIES4075_68010 [Tolypothrix sp. NIES-4075]|uniref:hypothetical protein n=1 Tax=Tolypothrix sp. NIES-4075 TaxID=2005459 RepID=UPI000B5C58ED|nr:hypothetical protein [Tolypothrix sp. NIES-4075]GAX45780.1 hypothetical protein NIES4075_68010 [Tolypothrix sp. NIES-4075]
MKKYYLIILLSLLLPSKAIAQVKMHQIEGEKPAIAVFFPGKENFTETILLGIRLRQTPVISDKCGNINTTYSQYNVGGELTVLDANQAIAKLVNVNELANKSNVLNGCATQDSKIIQKIVLIGFQPYKPYILQEKIQNYRKIHYNACGVGIAGTSNVIAYKDGGNIYFDVAGKRAETGEQLESFFSETLASLPICVKQKLYFPSGD